MRMVVLSAYFLVTLPIVTVWAASSMLATYDESLPFHSTCDGGGFLAQSLLRGFCSFGSTSSAEPAGGCLMTKTHNDFVFLFNEIAEEVLGNDAPDTRLIELSSDGCAPDGAGPALVTNYIDLHDMVMNKLQGF